jgi:cytochrome bd ubiquinol oxidase subunit II
MLHQLLPYAMLQDIWWFLLGFLLIGFAVMDGFDLGVATLLPFVSKTDAERRMTLNTVGPVWEGNQVWFILGGGAIFAAWPLVYAVAFSGFYWPLFLVLMALILRPVGFKFRSKSPNPLWRSLWDMALFISGFVPSLVFGVAVGNAVLGAPFHYDDAMHSFYTGSFFGLFTPFTLVCGVFSLLLLSLHGGVYLNLKADKPVSTRAQSIVKLLTLPIIALYCIILGLMLFTQMGYAFKDGTATSGLGLYASVLAERRWILVSSVVGASSLLLTPILLRKAQAGKAFITSSLAIIGFMASIGCLMYPFILPSSTDIKSSLMVSNASSSHMTLFIMLVSVVIFVPIILFYTAWVYRVLRGRVTTASVNNDMNSY